MSDTFLEDIVREGENLYLHTFKIELERDHPSEYVAIDTDTKEYVVRSSKLQAIEAVKEKNDPRIILSAYIANNKKTIIKVADNGTGMTEEVLDKIFIPFFSTKKHGSGIGLSLCKQIMMLHRGTIQVQSAEGEGTAFLLQF